MLFEYRGRNKNPLSLGAGHIQLMIFPYFFLFSGSPLAATTTTTRSTPFSTSTSNVLDRLSLPPYNPNHLPQKAEELLKTLVNPIGKYIYMHLLIKYQYKSNYFHPQIDFMHFL